MQPALLVAMGIILLIYSISVCRKLIPLIKWPYMRKSWRVLSYIMFLFLVGYGFYAYILLSPEINFTYILSDNLVGAILFLGAVFIAAVIRAGYQLVDWLATSEIEVMSHKRMLVYDQGMLEKDKKELDAKREEFENALEEVYTLRMAVEKGKGAKKTKKRLDELRSQFGGATN